MDFLEKDLEDIIFDAPNEELRERGFCIEGEKIRQLRIGNYGVSDIITMERPRYMPIYPEDKFAKYAGHQGKIIITIYELKKDAIDMDTFLQVIRYYKGVKSWLRRKTDRLHKYDINIVLVGRSMSDRSGFKYIPEISDIITFYTYSYSIEGLVFKIEDSWKLIDEGFGKKENDE